MAETMDSIIYEATMQYLNSLNPVASKTIEKIKEELIVLINDFIELRNVATSNKSKRYKYISNLPNAVIAQIILKLHPVVNIRLHSESTELAVYRDSGEKAGLYITDRRIIKQVIKPYNRLASEHDIQEIISDLECSAPIKELTKDKDLIAVNNGIFNYKSKTLQPFSKDMVFLSKSSVNYNPLAQNVTIRNKDGTDWDVESWMKSLSDDSGIVNLLWEVAGACIRPNVNWRKSAWLFSDKGNNGKGSYCKLVRNISSEECASLSVEDFGTDAFLENLMRATAIICDENDVGSYLDKAKKFKSAVTGDPISINRKYRSTITFTFHGFIVECINELPKVKDQSGSFTRRLLIIPMTKCFTGEEKPYIKDDYLNRTEVLEYVLYKVLNMNYYTLSEPEACRKMLAEYTEYNNPVVEYWNMFRTEFVWDLLPFTFLFDLYKAWYGQFYPSGKPLGHTKFCSEIRNAIRNDSMWEAKDYPIVPGSKLDKGERLVGEYDLKAWMDGTYSGADMNKKYRPLLRPTYRGLVRVAPAGGGIATDEEEEG